MSMEKSIYRVAVDCVRCSIGPHRIHVFVVAENEHEALDLATEYDNAKSLWDEDIQRTIASGETADHRDYQGLLEEVEYVGEIE